MSSLPESVERAFARRLLRDRARAFVRLDNDGQVVVTGGDLEWFGLEELVPGAPLVDQLESFQGLLPPELGTTQHLPRIELRPGRASEVHRVDDSDGPYLLFLDATDDAQREAWYQQRGNELGLLLRAWGVAVFEEDAGAFRSLGLAPAWMHALAGGPVELDQLVEHLPFLENFLVDARRSWAKGGSRPKWSGTWTEVDRTGAEWHLEASAARLEDGRRLLLVQSTGRHHDERQRILQEARSRGLDFHRLRREIDRKETLLHCIIHDLKGPLSVMVGSMSLIKSSDLDAERTRELLELGLEQARSQEALIRGILDAFVAEVESLHSFESEAGSAPNLLDCVRVTLEGYRAAFEQNRVVVSFEPPEGLGCTEVVGDRSRLERVLYNLLENALRHSPLSGVVRVRLEDLGEAFQVSIEDDGPGVPAEVEPELFQKFARGPRGGATGLGLYFCRATLNTWGGSIGYRPRPGGGSCFWFRLPRALPDE